MAHLEIVAPDDVTAGDEVSVAVKLQLDEPMDVKRIDLRVLGHEGWSDSSHTPIYNHRKAYVDTRIAVYAGGRLLAGPHSFDVWATIPTNAPPTHDDGTKWAQLRVIATVHRSLMRSDLRVTAWIRVHRGGERAGPLPRLPEPPTDQSIKLTVASRRIVVGERIVGTLATDSNDAGTYVVQLVAVHDDRSAATRVLWDSVTLTVPACSAGTPIPFEIPVSIGAAPSVESATQSRSWQLRAHEDGALETSGEATLALDLVELASTMRARPPARGSLLTDMFAAFAKANGWTVLDADRDPDLGVVRPAIERTADDVIYEMGYASAAPGGSSVVARASFPTLGLGLRVTPSSPLREMLSRDIESGRADWDRHHRAVARFDGQAEPIVRAVVPALIEAGHVGGLVRWTDDEIVLARVTDDPPLAEIAAVLAGVVAAIVEASTAIPPPPLRPEVDVAGWRALATSLRGRFVVGDLSIEDGSLDEAPVHAGVRWRDDEPMAIAATVGPIPDLSAAARAVVFAAGEQSEQLPQPAVDEVARWSADIVELRIVGGVATASRPYGPPAAAGELVECLRRVMAALYPRDGAYR